LKVEGGGFLVNPRESGLPTMETQGKETAMQDRKGKKVGKKGALKVVAREQEAALRACFSEGGQHLLPLLELVRDAKASVDELMMGAARQFIEQLLVISAQEVAGARRPGKKGGAVRWHGRQPGRITLAERKLALTRPRLRSRGGGEVAVPAYARFQEHSGLGARIHDILVTGVSTRKYGRVLPSMAGTVGIAKSSVSREFVAQSRRVLEALAARRWDGVDILAVYLDGIVVASHHILAAVGVDAEGKKHLLGLASGSSENKRVAKDLLTHLVEHGLNPDLARLFVIDGSKALRAAIEEVFGQAAQVQRCRTHKVRNVTERLPKALAAQVKSVMRAAYTLPEKAGMAKLKQQASWLKAEHADAAASLLEGLEEIFTVNRLGLTPALTRCLATTNLIENPNGAVRRVSGRVCRYRDAEMALRWTASGFLEAEKNFRRLQGHRELWVLAAALGRQAGNTAHANSKVA
jgi:transposase-like protein